MEITHFGYFYLIEGRACTVKDGISLFVALEEFGILESSSKINTLREILSDIPRKDLIRKVNEFEMSFQMVPLHPTDGKYSICNGEIEVRDFKIEHFSKSVIQVVEKAFKRDYTDHYARVGLVGEHVKSLIGRQVIFGCFGGNTEIKSCHMIQS